MNNKINRTVDELSKKLDEGVRNVLNSERFKNYLKTMSKFHNYSFNNTMLIFCQNENATLVRGYKSWQKDFNRQVKKGEKGIQIYAPCPQKIMKEIEKTDDKGNKYIDKEEVIIPRFKAVTVFDISQTEGEELTKIAENLQDKVSNYNELFEAIKKCSDFEISFKEIKENGVSIGGEEKLIIIKKDMSQAQTIKTLIHEIAHEKLHHNQDKSEERKKDEFERNREEVEAESIAFIVSNYFNIDSSNYSFDYISSWQERDLAEIKTSLQTIQETAKIFIEKIEENLSSNKVISIEDKIKNAVKESAKQENIKDKNLKRKKKEISL